MSSLLASRSGAVRSILSRSCAVLGTTTQSATTQRQQVAQFRTTPVSNSILKGLSPVLTADLLWVLRSAGHGDKIVIVDANFPANAIARQTTSGKHIELAGIDLPNAIDAICEVFPLDFFVDSPAGHMAPTEGPLPPLGQEAIDEATALIQSHCEGVKIEEIERFQFYDEAAEGFAIVQCIGERRPYANFILTKGVVGPDGKDLKP